jgi:hypothetical protein
MATGGYLCVRAACVCVCVCVSAAVFYDNVSLKGHENQLARRFR